MIKKVGVAILGLGVVGGGTYKTLVEHREYYKKTQGVDVSVESVLVRNKQKALDLGVDSSIIASSIAEVVANPAVIFFRDDIFSDDDLPFDFDIRSITKKILALFLSYMYLNITVYLLVDISISLVKKFIL